MVTGLSEEAAGAELPAFVPAAPPFVVPLLQADSREAPDNAPISSTELSLLLLNIVTYPQFHIVIIVSLLALQLLCPSLME